MKNKIFLTLQNQMHNDLVLLLKSADAAKQIATNPEFKAENKYDTRGLEASYFAGAQFARVEELSQQIESLRKVDLLAMKKDKVELYALVLLEKEQHYQYYFMLPFQGGTVVTLDHINVKVLTPSAPLGKQLLNRTKGEEVSIKIGDEDHDYLILDLI